MVKNKRHKRHLEAVPPWPLDTKEVKRLGFKKVSDDVMVRDNGDGTHCVAIAKEQPPLRLDLGCGPNKKPGFTGVDVIRFPNVDVVIDLAKVERWPWEDNSVEEAHCSHFLEHLDAMERVHFMNELYRVLKPGAKCQLIVPYGFSGRAYGDPTHKWPAIFEFSTLYWNRDWRKVNAPHIDSEWNPKGFNCHFLYVGGYTLHNDVATRNQEYQQYAVNWLKEAAQDMFGTLTKS